MNITLRVWRQKNRDDVGGMVAYEVADISADMSFLEMLDVLNEDLTHRGGDPVAFDHDCREGICGMCSMVINGLAHGPEALTTTCQLYMRHFDDGQVIDVEPWRSTSFPILRDLVVDRSALDRIIEAGGYISAPTGSAPAANATPVSRKDAERSFDAAACIGCGACVAACPNGSASLFLGAKLTHLGSLPQGQPERGRRALAMVRRHDAEGFGGCSQIGECTAVCPAGIPLDMISQLNHDVLVEISHNKHR
ncbi:succinate dehydrogenase/fumarate reductase iron-sulfur subunit [Rhodococcus sp. PAMC28707]|uniref:succinate dehydrogenase/fumarate reductase iron-sulfur subunit n=1 Tax=unclassified Rhodococcus (in: high G+C Gram-positive bacteria) TaxID=192944 RepID=UPI00109DF35D|nr:MULTISPECIES: succinate dehydrogenase/fumarate reductase iron-sulfur subunit [unclassified Rhodococcus (in: high G+C Gram-positive bacteria)]QCB49695.1 succinate dehydrogenase/fumarate reductase iron-sulfur subunit [Rhodococcus sp. PAMC28705]QCB58613.1 succinate dehydrogenase/fumarate reductase iron-sulfur subunit [Rhodococcus sp. PAMC28707]